MLDRYINHVHVDHENKTAAMMEAPWNTMLSNTELIAHENGWRIVAGIADMNLTPKQALKRKKPFIHNNDKWSPPMILFPSNLKPFPTGVGFTGDKMFINLNLLDDFDNHIENPQ